MQNLLGELSRESICSFPQKSKQIHSMATKLFIVSFSCRIIHTPHVNISHPFINIQVSNSERLCYKNIPYTIFTYIQMLSDLIIEDGSFHLPNGRFSPLSHVQFWIMFQVFNFLKNTKLNSTWRRGLRKQGY
ncbi:hypothetical protein EYC80_005097 [Monilinia laxa]|uniref:Uncharacterized protein n=1 Tax=Monilinia laxa TaxID=61186 RepID=A0A5N6KIV2_MONLA|nr:hypothetical protein EYC80_005097 [Monilinia laxa]